MTLALRLSTTNVGVIYETGDAARPTVAWPKTVGTDADARRAESAKGEGGVAAVAVATPILRPTPRSADRSPAAKGAAVRALQSWEGVVLSVRDESFTVRLVDVTGRRPDEEAEIDKEELSDFDLDLLHPGAIFYWTIGYRQQMPRGARERISQIRFRRLPAWSASELAAAQDRADALAHVLDW